MLSNFSINCQTLTSKGPRMKSSFPKCVAGRQIVYWFWTLVFMDFACMQTAKNLFMRFFPRTFAHFWNLLTLSWFSTSINANFWERQINFLEKYSLDAWKAGGLYNTGIAAQGVWVLQCCWGAVQGITAQFWYLASFIMNRNALARRSWMKWPAGSIDNRICRSLPGYMISF